VTEDPRPVLCPSAPAAPGAVLTGEVGGTGQIAMLATPLPIDATFIERAKAYAPLEERFRLAATCQEHHCGYWTGTECGLIGQLLQSARAAGAMPQAGVLPRCAIRVHCRWWQQRGPEACRLCPLIITDIGEAA